MQIIGKFIKKVKSENIVIFLIKNLINIIMYFSMLNQNPDERYDAEVLLSFISLLKENN
jgi:hypothetical protein